MKAIALIPGFWLMTLVASSGAVARDAQAATGLDGSTISIEAQAATSTPYRNQSILYTIRFAVRGGVSEISLSNPTASNAIIEPNGKPDIHDEVEHGVIVRVVSVHYIVTPLQLGKLTIPAVTLSGKFEAPDLSAMANPLGLKLSSGVRQAFGFFSANGGEPFSVTSNATQLNVRPPAAAMDFWLPLTSLKIIEDADAQHPIHIGEPLVRKITLLADGAVGSQLPALDPQPDNADFKAYADKPTMGEDIDAKNGAILGWRKESFSLIPQRVGRLVLPRIRISWWDLINKKRATAELPERAVVVLPMAGAPVARSIGEHAARQRTAAKPAAGGQLFTKPRLMLALLGVGVIIAALIIFMLWLPKSQRRYDQAGNEPLSGVAQRKQKHSKPTKVLARALDEVRTAEELKVFLQKYAHERTGISTNASLERIFEALPVSPEALEGKDVPIFVQGLSEALYAGKNEEIVDLKARVRRILSPWRRGPNARSIREESLQKLNPS